MIQAYESLRKSVQHNITREIFSPNLNLIKPLDFNFKFTENTGDTVKETPDKSY